MHGLARHHRPTNRAGVPQVLQPAVTAFLLPAINRIEIPAGIGFESSIVREKHFGGSTGWHNALLTGPDLLNVQGPIPLVGQIVNSAEGKKRSQLQLNCGCAVARQEAIGQHHRVLRVDDLHAFFDRPSLPLVGPSAERVRS